MLYLLFAGLYSTPSMSCRILSTPVLDAASISKKSTLLPVFISIVFEHLLHGCGVGFVSLSQFIHLAKIRAKVVLPTPLVPANI